MIVYTLDPDNPDAEAITAAADAIRRGELVIFPTETVYGLACDATNHSAVQKLIEAKRRRPGHPLPVQVASVDALDQVGFCLSNAARRLADAFWPGPLTIVVTKSSAIPDVVTGGLDSVGVRVPDHPVALALLRELNLPIVATSANITDQVPAVTADAAIQDLGGAVSVVLDSGPCRIGTPSTVVNTTVRPPRVERVGSISLEEIAGVLGEVA